MTDWLSEIKKLFQKQAPAKHDPPYLAAIAKDDPELLESARDWVQPEDIAPLLGLYWKLKQWNHKRAVIEFLQDQDGPGMREVMLDFLRVPLAPGDERTELAQAVALGFIHEAYARYKAYYNDRQLLARDVATVLSQHGLRSESLPPQPKPTVKPLAPTPGLTPDQRLLSAAQRGDTSALRQALREGETSTPCWQKATPTLRTLVDPVLYARPESAAWGTGGTSSRAGWLTTLEPFQQVSLLAGEHPGQRPRLAPHARH